MESRLVVVRHGRSAHVHRGWMNAGGVREWRNAYDAAGIAPGNAPPPALVRQARRADMVIASDAPRAIQSAERLAPDRQPVISPLLRESPLEIPSWMRSRWPLAVWEAAIHLQWASRVIRGVAAPPEELDRAAAAAEWLTGQVREGSTAIVVTHGVFRRLLTRQLFTLGWRAEFGWYSYRCWSAWEFRRGG